MLQKVASIFVVCLVLAGCNLTAAMDIPPVETSYTPPEISPSDDMAKVAFTKAIMKIRRGDRVFAYPAGMRDGVDTDSFLCNYNYRGSDNGAEWATGSRDFAGWDSEFSDIFAEAMTSQGYDVASKSGNLFEPNEELRTADIYIGAQLVDLRGNFCEDHNLNGIPMGLYSGEAYMKIDWEAYSPATRESIGTFQTEGYFVQKKGRRQGVMMAFMGAFSEATAMLGADPKYVALVTGTANNEGPWIPKTYAERVVVPGPKTSRLPIARVINDRTAGVVRIRSGSGHGSGFAISSNGWVLTNHHVVGSREEVTVIFPSGIQISAPVVRRDKVRDVALLRVPLKGIPALPINTNARVNNLDKVTAIGAPLSESLHSTVSQGVVSALRKREKTGVKLIQADVDIHGGNSGGPLLDDKGNVIGISVAGEVGSVRRTSIGINYFIPIEDAMTAMGIKLNQG